MKIRVFQDYDPEWTLSSACAGQAEFFHPDSFTDEWKDLAYAKDVCASCDVRLVCLDYAISGREEEGLWGGLLAKERRSLQLGWIRDLPQFLKEVEEPIEDIVDKLMLAEDVFA